MKILQIASEDDYGARRFMEDNDPQKLAETLELEPENFKVFYDDEYGETNVSLLKFGDVCPDFLRHVRDCMCEGGIDYLDFIPVED